MRHHVMTPLLLLALSTTPLSAGAAQGLAGSYLLKVSPGAETLTVRVNGKTFGLTKASPDLSTDITRVLKPGPNRLQVSWKKLPGHRMNTVSIAYASTPGKYRTVFDYNAGGPFTPENGDFSFTVVADGPKGSGRVSTGSARDQTVLKTNMVKGYLRVWVNGADLGHYAGITTRDISSYVKPGPNTVRVAWAKDYGEAPPMGGLDVAHAARKDAFRTLFSWNTPVIIPRTGEKTFTVNVPAQR